MLRIKPVGDRALQLTLDDASVPNPDTVRRVQCLQAAIERASLAGVRECHAAYRSLLVVYDSLATSTVHLQRALESIARGPDLDPAASRREPVTHRLLLCACPRCAPDGEFASAHSGMAWYDFITVYCSVSYQVLFLGFQPGFPFLGILDSALQLPRLSEPRLTVEAGSVGIGNHQTGIYPFASPGGWRIIGRTPAELFNFTNDPPNRLCPGDRVVFEPAFDHQHVHLVKQHGPESPK